MATAPAIQEITRRRKIGRIFKSVVSGYGLVAIVDENDLTLGEHVTVEHTGSRKLSNAILDNMFPKEPSPCELFHYTSLTSLINIASTGQLRLYWARKRIGQGELDTFARKHRLKGYLDGSEGEAFYKTLSDDLFYTSLTRPGGGDEFDLWRSFAEGGSGVRLRLSVSPSRAELRAIQYEDTADTLLKKLNDALVGEGERPFVPWSLSKIGAFYLPSTLHREDEVRLLIKGHPGGRDDVEDDTNNKYWPLPIGISNDFCLIELLEIHLGPIANRSDIQAAIANTRLHSVPIV